MSNSLFALNDFNATFTLNYTDDRSAQIVFDRLVPVNQYTSALEHTNHTIPLGIDMTDIVQGSSLSIYFIIDLTNLPSASVDWGTIPPGCTTTEVNHVYSIGPITTMEIWNQVKDAVIISNTYGTATHTYSSRISYSPSSQKVWTITLSMSVGVNAMTDTTLQSTAIIAKPSGFYTVSILDLAAHATVIGSPQWHHDVFFDIQARPSNIIWADNTNLDTIVDILLTGQVVQPVPFACSINVDLSNTANRFVGGFYDLTSNNTLSSISNGKFSKSFNAIATLDLSSYGIRNNYLITDTSSFNYTVNVVTVATNNPTINNDYIGYEGQNHTIDIIPSTTSAIDTLDLRLVSNSTASGSVVDISGDGTTMVTGDKLHDNSGGTDAGSVYIYVRSGTTWVQQTRLQASDAAAGDNFGTSVALSYDGNTLAVGAPNDDNSGGTDAGSVYIFTRSGTTWTQQTRLQASDAAIGNNFGFSVALSYSGDILASGSPIYSPSIAGYVYMFTRSSGTWTQRTKLQGISGYERFGYAVSLSSNGYTLIVGGDDGFYVCTGNGLSWSRNTHWHTSTYSTIHRAISISSDGTTVAVGQVDAGTGNNGVYVYTRSGTTLTLQSKLNEINAASDSKFGFSVSLSSNGNSLAVGYAYSASNNNNIYIFNRVSTTWYQNYIVYSGTPSHNHMVSLSEDGSLLGIADTTSNGTVFIYDTINVTKSFNNTTKVLTLTGLKDNLNTSLNNILMKPSTGYTSNFTLTYRYYNPSLSSHIDRIEDVIHV